MSGKGKGAAFIHAERGLSLGLLALPLNPPDSIQLTSTWAPAPIPCSSPLLPSLFQKPQLQLLEQQ